jgi:hypothetical protein
MTLVIASRQDMGRVTRLLVAHPDWRYHSRRGEGGVILVDVDDTSATEADS